MRTALLLWLTETFTQISLLVYEDFGRDDCAEWKEHLQEILIRKLLWQMINEQVGAIRT